MKELLNAIQSKDINTIQELLINKKYNQKEQGKALQEAAKIGSISAIQLLIKYGANVNAKYYNPLKHAIINNHFSVVEYLISHGCDMNENTLYYAARVNNLEMFKYLQTNQENADERGILLKEASICGNYRIAKYLIDKNTYSKENIHNSFIEAVKNKQYNVTNCFIDSTQMTSEIASECIYSIVEIPGNCKTLEKLSKFVDIKTLKETTILTSILQVSQNINMLKFFVENGFSVKVRSEGPHVFCPIYLAISQKETSFPLVKYLFDQGSTIFVSHLVIPRAAINTKVFKYLQKKGFNIHENNNRALEMALYYNNLDVVKIMIEDEKENISLLNKTFESAVYYNADIAIMDYLIACGADPFCYESETLELAIYPNTVEDVDNPQISKTKKTRIFKYLTTLGLNVHIDNDRLLQAAIYNNNIDIVKIIVEDKLPSKETIIGLGTGYQQKEIRDYLANKISSINEASACIKNDNISCTNNIVISKIKNTIHKTIENIDKIFNKPPEHK